MQHYNNEYLNQNIIDENIVNKVDENIVKESFLLSDIGENEEFNCNGGYSFLTEHRGFSKVSEYFKEIGSEIERIHYESGNCGKIFKKVENDQFHNVFGDHNFVEFYG